MPIEPEALNPKAYNPKTLKRTEPEILNPIKPVSPQGPVDPGNPALRSSNAVPIPPSRCFCFEVQGPVSAWTPTQRPNNN